MDRFTKAYLKIIKEATGDIPVDGQEETSQDTTGMWCFMFEGSGENWEEDASENGFIGEREEGYTGNPNTVNLRMYARPDQVDDAKSYLMKILSVGKPDNLYDGLEGCETCDLSIADEH